MRIGLSPGMLSGYERGVRRPSLMTLAKMACVFECEVEEILAGVSSDEILGLFKRRRKR